MTEQWRKAMQLELYIWMHADGGIELSEEPPSAEDKAKGVIGSKKVQVNLVEGKFE